VTLHLYDGFLTIFPGVFLHLSSGVRTANTTPHTHCLAEVVFVLLPFLSSASGQELPYEPVGDELGSSSSGKEHLCKFAG
jgi:hypothetical protein